MQTFLAVAQILVAIFLIATVLLQVRGMGTGLFAQSEATPRVRRGLDLLLFRFTILLVAIFIALSILSVRLSGL